MRKQKLIRRRFFSLLCLVIMLIGTVSAEGLFPTLDQMFGTALPSIGTALGRAADETADTELGKEETYRGFTYDDYTAFGAYLAGAGAVLQDTAQTDSAITAVLSVRDASMEFSYDWNSQTATALYPSGTRPETEKEAVETKASILPPVGGIMPSAQFAVNRKPDREDNGGNGITQVWENFTDADYSAFSTYLAQTGAVLKQSSVDAGVLTAEISMNGCSFTFIYDWHMKTATVFYPNSTSPEREKRNLLTGKGSILPQMDTIGKDLPSMSQALSREPDAAEILDDGSRIETYNSFDEADYMTFSQYLQASGCTVDDYHVEYGSVIVITLSNVTGSFTFTYDNIRHVGTVTYPYGSRVEKAWVSPTPIPTAVPTPKPTATAKATPKPTAKPTAAPKATRKPTAKPTAKPSSGGSLLSKQDCIDLAKLYFTLHIASSSAITFTDTSMSDSQCLVMFIYSNSFSTRGIGILVDRKTGDILQTQRFNP